MFGIGLPEMIVILAVALIVVGPDKLPDMARTVAKWVFELKKTVNQVKESLEDVGRQVVHELERYLNALGTIASVTPLIGLLGTVIGMIEVFNVISAQGTSNTELLADGISKALITTAGGLTVAIPSLLFYRYLM